MIIELILYIGGCDYLNMGIVGYTILNLVMFLEQEPIVRYLNILYIHFRNGGCKKVFKFIECHLTEVAVPDGGEGKGLDIFKMIPEWRYCYSLWLPQIDLGEGVVDLIVGISGVEFEESDGIEVIIAPHLEVFGQQIMVLRHDDQDL